MRMQSQRFGLALKKLQAQVRRCLRSEGFLREMCFRNPTPDKLRLNNSILRGEKGFTYFLVWTKKRAIEDEVKTKFGYDSLKVTHLSSFNSLELNSNAHILKQGISSSVNK
jgi:hypothetical protein